MRSFLTSRPLKKLDNPTNEPFEVTDNVYSSFKLKLFESIKVHPVFYPGRLRKAPNDPTPGQIIPEPDPINITGELALLANALSTNIKSFAVFKFKGTYPLSTKELKHNKVFSPLAIPSEDLSAFSAALDNPFGAQLN
ncbi:hypothetical protein MBM_09656 [Drepanopeziza brunnea f. sp. 'multigermtubi' MB_m1]|uniref:Uncharacterized protein n=1 Tax=Marssonina brunnea f. sp. multigermtubi (strain MB_m1) TaxID=1072389 RepID=K1WJ22_MARBU|nr:uncharacterized protein MBM_09656 [Drepanopeziza brunnea f. sp. 'multigermtubi' MB_m1]EKD12157.1 hypothetical protein MBM_09656 [Drepanopeziza brunnea f. sp. 'multigermtubi' MB_m1]